jgi:hypothetical protein
LLQQALDKVKMHRNYFILKIFLFIFSISLKDNNNPDILVNMIVLCQHMGKPIEITNRYITQLKDSHKNHPFVKDFINKVDFF